jgi:citrate synthase
MYRAVSLSAAEAAAELGVTRATLYAYVSRGLIRSEAGPDGRVRRYHAEDVRRLVARREGRRDPAAAVRDALHWGMPVLDSALTLIRDGRLWYRGEDALALARTRRIEDVAALLWLDRADAAALPAQPPPPPPPSTAGLPLLEAFQTALAAAAATDVAAGDARPEGTARTGLRILRLLTAVATGAAPSTAPVATTLSHAWTASPPPRASPTQTGAGLGYTAAPETWSTQGGKARDAARAAGGGTHGAAAGGDAARSLDAALILCADHELNVSSFTVRCVASAGATPYAAVIAGLSALSGHRHGGMVARVTALLDEAATHGPDAAVAAHLQRGERVPGFGHVLYPDGDPRGALLLNLARAARPESPHIAAADRLIATVRATLTLHPTLDLGLAVLARALTLPDDAGLGLFAIGRTVGWIAHIMEERAVDRLIRPRARYTGRVPATNDCPPQ